MELFDFKGLLKTHLLEKKRRVTASVESQRGREGVRARFETE